MGRSIVSREDAAAGALLTALITVATLRASPLRSRPAVSDQNSTPPRRRDNRGWAVDHPAVRVDKMKSGPGRTDSVGLEHVAHPFTRVISASPGTGFQDGLERVGNDYLSRVAPVVGIGEDVLAALRKDDVPGFGWITLSWGNGEQGAQRNSNGSFSVTRRTRAGKVLDRTVVLLAGYRLPDRSTSGGEIGLRLVMHVAGADKRLLKVRVTGLTVSHLPAKIGRAAQAPATTLQVSMLQLRERLRAFHHAEEISVQGIVPAHPNRGKALRLFGNVMKSNGRVFAFVNETSTGGAAFKTVAMLELVSSATGPAALPAAFDGDPQSCLPQHEFRSRRTIRSGTRLDPLRCQTARLMSPLQKVGVVEVRQTSIGRSDDTPDPTMPQTIDLHALPLHSDALSAAHAYLRGDEFMQRFEAYGLAVIDYFKFAKLPLVLRHRAPIRGAQDGATINAQVTPHGVGPSLAEVPSKGGDPRAGIEVSFAAANLRRRGRVEVLPKRWRLQPMGLAADRRWAWHEFCHVLNFASFGKLEFRFAHSAGDALAAIVADPDSAIANSSISRNITFPWVSLGRRHDRDPEYGWGCCGRRNITRLASSTAFDDTRRGYFEEQLLSSALFRFYRVIGGDCAATDDRRSASDYAVYLVFRAIQLMGQSMTPIRTIEGFVTELRQADTGTEIWDVVAPWPENSPARAIERVGGCVQKVLRWAFERQGLYATDDPATTVEGLGLPPKVDIFIADARPLEYGDAPTGSGDYWPVPLQWSTADEPWHASDAGITERAGLVIVTVRNRGADLAKDVVVSCWVWPAVVGPAPTLAAPWQPKYSAPQDVPPGSTIEFAFDPRATVSGPYFVLAEATCDADLANADPASGQPCATVGAPLLDLVANDNNLGLRVLNL